MTTLIPLNKLKRALTVMWTLLVIGGFLAEVWKPMLRAFGGGELVRFFGLSYERNLPTWYSSSILLLCAFHLAAIALAKREANARGGRYWWGLAAAFLYISLDETVGIHEGASDWFDFDGFLYFGWVIPASVVVVIFGLAYLRFLFRLPRRTRTQFIVAGSVYVGGALGVEFLLGYWTDLHGSLNLVYGLIDLVEESMEILGASLFLCSLVEYLGAPVPPAPLLAIDATPEEWADSDPTPAAAELTESLSQSC